VFSTRIGPTRVTLAQTNRERAMLRSVNETFAKTSLRTTNDREARHRDGAAMYSNPFAEHWLSSTGFS